MIRQRNGRYEIVVYLGTNAAGKERRVSRTARTEREARRIERALFKERDDGRGADGDASFGRLMDRWLELAPVEASTRYLSRIHLDRHVRPVLGDVKVSRLRPEHLDDLYAGMLRGVGGRKPISPSSVRRVHSTVSSVLALAIRWGWIARSPAERAQPPLEAHQEPQAPSSEAVVALLAHLSEEPELALFVRLGAVTGMRRGELCALRRLDVDLEAGIVRKVHALGLAKGAPYLKATKTGIRHTLAIDPETADLLRLHWKAQDGIAAHYRTSIGPDGFLFSHDHDCARPWRPEWPTKAIRKLRKDVPLAAGVTLRSLRHWMITEGLDAGISAKAVSGRAGHARTSITTDRYAAWVPASDRTLSDLLARALAQDRDGEREW